MKSDGVENPTEMEESEILIFLIIIIAAIYTSWYFFILLFSQFAKLVTRLRKTRLLQKAAYIRTKNTDL